MIIEDIFSIPPDKRISNKHISHISAHSNKIVGHLYLNPQLSCAKECYSGMLNDTLCKLMHFLIRIAYEININLQFCG